MIEKLDGSNVHTVSLLARRGIFQSAFTTKEMREILWMEDVKTYILNRDIEESRNEASLEEGRIGANNQAWAISRRTAMLMKDCIRIDEDDYDELVKDTSHKKVMLRYLLHPDRVTD